MPAETSRMCHLFFEGKVQEAAKMQMDLIPLINALFCEVNPIPAKAAVSALGFGKNILRLPLTEMESEHEANLLQLMRYHGILG